MVYAPVPEVSMMDLTIHVEREDPDLYRAVCGVMLAQAQGPLSSVLKYVKKMGDETRYSCTIIISSVYTIIAAVPVEYSPDVPPL